MLLLIVKALSAYLNDSIVISFFLQTHIQNTVIFFNYIFHRNV